MATTTTASTAHPAEAHGNFPPFDSSTFGSQLVWLALAFGALYLLMSKVALPRVASILEERHNRVSSDLDQAAKLKAEDVAEICDAAIVVVDEEGEGGDGERHGAALRRGRVAFKLTARRAWSRRTS